MPAVLRELTLAEYLQDSTLDMFHTSWNYNRTPDAHCNKNITPAISFSIPEFQTDFVLVLVGHAARRYLLYVKCVKQNDFFLSGAEMMFKHA